MKARGIFPSPPSRDSKTLSSVKLASLLDDWLRTNGADSFRGFQQAVNNRLLAYDCGCREASHKCYLKNCWSLSSSLLEVLAADLSLEVEGMADALHHSPILGEWWSKDTIDLQFGAKLDFFAQDCTGRNVYVNPPFNDFGRERNVAVRVIDKAAHDIATALPTRFLLVIPRYEDKDGGKGFSQAVANRFLEIARFRKVVVITP